MITTISFLFNNFLSLAFFTLSVFKEIIAVGAILESNYPSGFKQRLEALTLAAISATRVPNDADVFHVAVISVRVFFFDDKLLFL